ncbi:MAG: C25 family cysteine peptidase [Candidatus Zixiibacteriota bacterium]
MFNRKGLNQRKLALPLLLLVGWFSLGAGPLWAEQTPQWIELTPGMEKTPQVSVLQSDFQQVIFDVQVSGMWSADVSTKGGTFNQLGLPEYGVTNVVGEPNLPVIRKMVQIPYGAEVSVEVVSSQSQEKSLAELGILNRIIPVQPPIPKVEGALENAPFVIHEDAYQKDGFYPTELARKGAIDVMRGHRFVTVEIFPVSYNPHAATVKLYSYVKVKVNLQGSDRAQTEAMLRRYASPPFDDICQHMFINYPSYQDLLKGAPAVPMGYLIIVHNDFQAQAAPLAEWKRKKGFVVTVATTSQTGTTTTSIKNYIQNAYNTWTPPPTYVLLFGDVGWIPTYTGTFSSTATDLYYVQMNSDRFGDIFRARFPVRSTTEATDIVNKLLYYEKPTATNLEWMRHDLFIASSDDNQMAEFTHRFVIQNYLIPNGNIIDSLWERLGTPSPTTITNSVNAGKTIVCYSGHGSQTGWATGSYSSSNVQGLTNADKYPLVTSHACLTGQFDQTECFGETWVKGGEQRGHSVLGRL